MATKREAVSKTPAKKVSKKPAASVKDAAAKKPGMKQSSAKKAPVGDVTSTARAKSLLQRLEEQGGKRVVIDFDAPGHEALQTLLTNNYGKTQKEAVIRAVQAAAARFGNRKVVKESSQRTKKA